ncbi:MAG: iron ABC transporter permease [Rikenellaceae bacterium]
MISRRQGILFILFTLLLVALFGIDMMTGDLDITLSQMWAAFTGGECDPLTNEIIWKIRFIKSIVALIVGVALSAAGLQMQTLFCNPLAGPYVLGVSSGAALGVSLFLLGAPLLGLGYNPFWQSIGIAGAAWLGSAAILIVMMIVSQRLKDIMAILVLGMMLGSGVGSMVEILQYLSEESALKSFVIWTMGSLGDVTQRQLMVLSVAVIIGILLTLSIIKPLNILLLGENYARTMGVNLSRTRAVIFTATTLLSGSVTAFCGPIGFVGLAIPHVARMIFRTSDHATLIPASMLLGAVMMLGCDIISKSLLLPINAITALAGIPIVVVVILQNRTIG